jgi:DDE superfamily endonuclease
MANRKDSEQRRQALQNRKLKKSRHDKQKRLRNRNSNRKKTTQAKVPLAGAMRTAVAALQAVLDRRIAFRLAIVVAGMFLADGRLTASAWFVAGGVQDDWDRFYDCLIGVGRTSNKLATAMLGLIVQKFAPKVGERIVLAIDDSPTSRYGKCVEGAGVHRNPTPGPADGEWLYGHNWVTLAWLATHPTWGVIALPLRSLLYVRKVDAPKLAEKYDWEFRTKHQLGVELMTRFFKDIRAMAVQATVWLAVDGAYAAAPFVKPLLTMGVTVVSRLRKDACLHDLPPEPEPGQRGRPCIYGKNKLSLARRARHREGWQEISYDCRGVEVTRRYKTFLATSRLTSGVIRVVIVRFDDGGWAPYFCTDASAEVRDILEAVAARWAIEEQFHDVKEVGGAGQQQVRNIWSNIGCWNLIGWLYALVELCCWDIDKSELTDRSDRPWDNPQRRPSHADRRRTIAREMLHQTFITALPGTTDNHKFRKILETLIALAT